MTAEQERAAIVAWFRSHAQGVQIDADAGLWAGIEGEVKEVIAEFNGYADAIERGDHIREGHTNGQG